ncbi:MAG: deoxyribonuclease V [Candidatus Krumholzibacteria bacterium]|nr:deoxyribonuclease V [Candidatus Krumholzibacteria bacterium]
MKKRTEYTRWNVTPRDGIELQRTLCKLVSRKWDGRKVKRIAGMDVHFPSKDTARAAAVILTYPKLEMIESSIHECPCTFPYIPGLLSFREIPPLLEALKKLKVMPDLVLCDGQGIAHPRGVGLATHLGILLELPTIGCAKSPLFGTFNEPGTQKGNRSPILDKSKKTIGTVLRTRTGTRPLYVSIGYRIDLQTAVRFVLSSSPRFRIPEPLRAAHRLAGEKK